MNECTFDSINDDFEEKVNVARMKSQQFFGKELKVFYPSRSFPSISITGTSCDQNCLYCNKRYLEHMISIKSPDKLLTFAKNLEMKGGEGILISGGFNKEAILPVEPYLNVIKEIKEKTNLKINLHPGLINKSQAQAIKDANVDTISFDLVTNDQVIEEILRNGNLGKDYIESYEIMLNVGLNVVPHICLGLYHGSKKGNIEAINTALKHNPKLIVFLGFIPTKNTPMAEDQTIEPNEFLKLLVYTRLKQPTIEQSLGCMRVRQSIFERYAIQAGINRIAVPKRKTITYAIKKFDLEIIELASCCAI